MRRASGWRGTEKKETWFRWQNRQPITNASTWGREGLFNLKILFSQVNRNPVSDQIAVHISYAHRKCLCDMNFNLHKLSVQMNVMNDL